MGKPAFGGGDDKFGGKPPFGGEKPEFKKPEFKKPEGDHEADEDKTIGEIADKFDEIKAEAKGLKGAEKLNGLLDEMDKLIDSLEGEEKKEGNEEESETEE